MTSRSRTVAARSASIGRARDRTGAVALSALLALCPILASPGPALASVAIGTGGRATARVSDPAASRTPAAGPTRTLPFHTVRGFILLDGEVDGVPGVFILDTGTPFNFFLNRQRVPLPEGERVAVGNAASGQAVEVRLHRGRRSIRLGATTFRPDEVRSGDFGFVANGLGIPLLGFVGIGLLRDYRFEIDHRRNLVVLYPLAASVPKRPRPIATIRFRLDGQNPQFIVAAGGITLPAMLDSGTPDVISLTPATRDRLRAAGLLVTPADGGRTIGLRSLRIGSSPLGSAEAADGGDGKDLVLLGHGFLARYRSVWDYGDRTVTLYPR